MPLHTFTPMSCRMLMISSNDTCLSTGNLTSPSFPAILRSCPYACMQTQAYVHAHLHVGMHACTHAQTQACSSHISTTCTRTNLHTSTHTHARFPSVPVETLISVPVSVSAPAFVPRPVVVSVPFPAVIWICTWQLDYDQGLLRLGLLLDLQDGRTDRAIAYGAAKLAIEQVSVDVCADIWGPVC